MHCFTCIVLQYAECFIREYQFSMFKLLGECIALWGQPNEPNIQYHIYIFTQCVCNLVAIAIWQEWCQIKVYLAIGLERLSTI